MTSSTIRRSALVFGVLTALATTQAAAVQITPDRAAALERCNSAAVNRYPVDGQGGYGRERSEWYQQCMAGAGQVP